MPETVAQPFAENPPGGPGVRGFLHQPRQATGDAWVLTHGAGGNCGSHLLVSLAACFSAAGICVLRCDLPFRQARRQGPPHPSGAAKDREGLRAAVEALRRIAPGRVFLGGQSYGGRQATMLSAESAAASSERSRPADGLILLSYPLHAPQTPQRKRNEHFPQLNIPALFIHGTNDPFGALPEMEEAIRLIPAKTRLAIVEGAGHGLIPARASGVRTEDVASRILSEFQSFFGA